MESMYNMHWGEKDYTSPWLSFTESYSINKDKLIGDKECHCIQVCPIPDPMCEHCEGTGLLSRPYEYKKALASGQLDPDN